MQNNTLCLGIDIGSTTIKFMLTDGEKELFSCYERHFSRVREKTVELLERAHILVSPGDVFGLAGKQHFRIACTVDIEKLREAYDRMEALRF